MDLGPLPDKLSLVLNCQVFLALWAIKLGLIAYGKSYGGKFFPPKAFIGRSPKN
jgi:hypothetical protein